MSLTLDIVRDAARNGTQVSHAQSYILSIKHKFRTRVKSQKPGLSVAVACGIALLLLSIFSRALKRRH